MKAFKLTLGVFLVVVSINSLSPSTFAQDKRRLPSGLNQDSSLVEVLNWLDQNGFANASVGLNTSEVPGDDGSGPYHQDSQPSQKPVFSRGFKLANLETCTVTLRNDDMRILRRPNKLYEWEMNKSYVAELYIPLYRLSPSKGGSPYAHTSDFKKAQLFGSWRTEFKHRGFFARHDIGLSFFPAGHRELQTYIDGETLTFTFDDKEMSEKFSIVFHRAIKLCQRK